MGLAGCFCVTKGYIFWPTCPSKSLIMQRVKCGKRGTSGYILHGNYYTHHNLVDWCHGPVSRSRSGGIPGLEIARLGANGVKHSGGVCRLFGTPLLSKREKRRTPSSRQTRAALSC